MCTRKGGEEHGCVEVCVASRIRLPENRERESGGWARTKIVQS